MVMPLLNAMSVVMGRERGGKEFFDSYRSTQSTVFLRNLKSWAGFRKWWWQ